MSDIVRREKRQSMRVNKGQPPARYPASEGNDNFIGPRRSLDGNVEELGIGQRSRVVTTRTTLHNDGAETNDVNVAGMGNHDAVNINGNRSISNYEDCDERRSVISQGRVSGLSNTSSSQRRRLAELEAAKAVAEIEAEADKRRLEMELKMDEKRVQREKSLIAKKLELEKAVIEDEGEYEVEGGIVLEEEPSRIHNLQGPPSSKVDEWLEKEGESKGNDNNSSIIDLSKALCEAMKMCMATTITPNNNGDDIKKFVARQSNFKDLIEFNGEPEEWPGFIADFRESTEHCSYSDVENMGRLRKCLKGKAKEAVQSLMLVPANVNRIIETLETTFGRPELIVNILIQKAKKIPNSSEDKPESLIELANAVQNLVATMESLKKTGHMMNPQLISDLVGKLPSYAKFDWAQHMITIEEEISLQHLSKWLQGVGRAMGRIDTSCHLQSSRRRSHGELLMTATEAGGKKVKCPFCRQGDHELSRCEDFLHQSVEARWEWLRRRKDGVKVICFSCLGEGHGVRQCEENVTCGKGGCQKSHHHCLHKNEEIEGEEEVVGIASQTTSNRIQLKVIPVKVSGPKGEISTYAVLDEGSTVSLVDCPLADEIGVEGAHEELKLRWMNEGGRTKCRSRRVNLSITGPNNENYKMKDVRTIDDLDLPAQWVDVENLIGRWKHLKRVHLKSLEGVKPMMLIGMDNWDLIATRDIISGPRDAPAVSKTKLGWVLHGHISNTSRNSEFTFNIWEGDLDKEDFGVKVIQERLLSKEDVGAAVMLDDRLKTELQWKDEVQELSTGKSINMRKKHLTEMKVDTNPSYFNKFCSKKTEMKVNALILLLLVGSTIRLRDVGVAGNGAEEMIQENIRREVPRLEAIAEMDMRLKVNQDHDQLKVEKFFASNGTFMEMGYEKHQRALNIFMK